MKTYAIGDVQGCYRELMDLLEKIAFNPTEDRLWFAGDLVNRGPDSLRTLRYVANLPVEPIVVLGNHDLHLLALAENLVTPSQDDTCQEILAAPDRDKLLNWLRHRPLAHHDPRLKFVMAHAGIYPLWSLNQTLNYANEVEAALRGTDAVTFLSNMYGNTPERWSNDLSGQARLRFITNAFTRMRFCKPDGALALDAPPHPKAATSDLIPWFRLPHRVPLKAEIVFGHWAALGDGVRETGLYHTDTGCVWGGALTALRLEDRQWFHVPSRTNVRNA